MPKSIIVNIFTADPADIARKDNGTPSIAATTSNARLYLATVDGSGGWTLETWSDDAEGAGPTQRMAALADIEALTQSVTETIHMIARDVN